MNDRLPNESLVTTQECAPALPLFFEYIVITEVQFQRRADIDREGKYTHREQAQFSSQSLQTHSIRSPHKQILSEKR